MEPIEPQAYIPRVLVEENERLSLVYLRRLKHEPSLQLDVVLRFEPDLLVLDPTGLRRHIRWRVLFDVLYRLSWHVQHALLASPDGKQKENEHEEAE